MSAKGMRLLQAARGRLANPQFAGGEGANPAGTMRGCGGSLPAQRSANSGRWARLQGYEPSMPDVRPKCRERRWWPAGIRSRAEARAAVRLAVHVRRGLFVVANHWAGVGKGLGKTGLALPAADPVHPVASPGGRSRKPGFWQSIHSVDGFVGYESADLKGKDESTKLDLDSVQCTFRLI